MSRFGLYASAAMLAAERITATTTLALDTPVDADGGVHFGRSLWLPLPAGLAQAQRVRLLAGGALSVRFEARRFEVGVERRDWFTAVERVDGDTTRIDFAWPAEVVRIASPRSGGARQLSLFRADGKAVAEAPAQQGRTGRDLAQAWVGSPLVIQLGGPALSLVNEAAFEVAGPQAGVVTLKAQAAAPARALRPAGDSRAADIGASSNVALARVALAAVPALTLSGRPTSPRLKLFAESAAGDTLLWQSMLAGDQSGAAVLPAQPIADEWAPALEQLRKLSAAGDGAAAPLRLRLDIESDAPCTATLGAPVLVVETETELLAAPQRLAFSGNRAEQQPVAVTLPAMGPGDALRLSGRLAADNAGAAAAGSQPADGRRGALLDDDTLALQALDLAAPVSLAGVALHWQPLSDRAVLRLRLLADSNGGPGTRVLAQAEEDIDTSAAGALALRWPPVDLQAQRAWVEVTVSAGAGVWLFAAAGAPAWIDRRSAAGARQPLPMPLTLAPIPAQPAGAPSRAIGVRLGDTAAADALPQGPFELTLPAGASGGIVFTGAVRGSVSVESLRWVRRDGG